MILKPVDEREEQEEKKRWDDKQHNTRDSSQSGRRALNLPQTNLQNIKKDLETMPPNTINGD
jgi:hypothetical protein